MRRDPSTTVATRVVAVVVSVVAHWILWSAGDVVLQLTPSDASLPRVPGRSFEIDWVSDPEEPSAERSPPPRPDGELVKLDYLVEERAPDNTRYISEFDNRVDRETRAPRRRPSEGQAEPAGQPRARPDGSDAPTPTMSTSTALRLLGREPTGSGNLAQDGRGVLDPSEDGEQAARGGGQVSPVGGIASLSPRGVEGLSSNLRKQWGGPGTMDLLDPELDEGDGNLLNTTRFRFASFFNRVRDQIAAQWHPEAVHAAHDPDGSRFGSRSRKTKLAISLNPDGTLHWIHLIEGSGVGYLDEEAIRAVRAAAPFSNPPEQLVDPSSGHIDFLFGFILEIGGDTRVIRYRY